MEIDVYALLERVAAVLPPEMPAHLVGGAVRDLLLGRPVHDMDFALPGDVLVIARRVADALGAAYYPLDTERGTARLVFIYPDNDRLVMDFAAWRGPDLESDLRGRDFTVNAMALNIRQTDELIDPLHGAADLRARRLQVCSPTALLEDPVRCLRAVRQAGSLKLQMTAETRAQARQAAPQLESASPERVRDELFRMLSGRNLATAMRTLDLLGILPYVLPELPPLRGVQQSPPHIHDVWEHTLDVVSRLEGLLDVLDVQYAADGAGNLNEGLAVLRVGRYREQIASQLNTLFTPDRSARALLFLAALYHDVGKPRTRSVQADGRVRFFGHEDVGAELTLQRAQALRLSSAEIERLTRVVQHHMRPLLMGQGDQPPTRRAIYRFFRQTGPAGVEVCLLTMADYLGTYGVTLDQAAWRAHLDVVRALLEAWWERADEQINPTPLVKGHLLMRRFDLKPGAEVGRLLAAIQEAQAAGEVTTLEEALALAQKMLLDAARD